MRDKFIKEIPKQDMNKPFRFKDGSVKHKLLKNNKERKSTKAPPVITPYFTAPTPCEQKVSPSPIKIKLCENFESAMKMNNDLSCLSSKRSNIVDTAPDYMRHITDSMELQDGHPRERANSCSSDECLNIKMVDGSPSGIEAYSPIAIFRA